MELKIKKMINPLDEMTLEDFVSLSEYYIHKERMLNAKGLINYNHRIIYYNPQFQNENGATLIHELLHHYYDKKLGIKQTEKEIEDLTQIIYNKNRDYLNNYVINLFK